jgi:hypothetical protein
VLSHDLFSLHSRERALALSYQLPHLAWLGSQIMQLTLCFLLVEGETALGHGGCGVWLAVLLVA